MKIEQIRARIEETEAKGFRPFRLVMASGNKYPVPHPDFLFMTSRVVIVADSRGYAHHLDPFHIVGLEEMRNPPGKRPRKRTKGR
ncbi:MAG: hypothetical protein C5B50_27700 [Verrucomicrobia bacterium]|nr:MAG: hypothetical protein C5B50_27700 [Verrucomicrobiota bacterium]